MGRNFGAMLFFLALAIVSTRPLLGSIQTHLPLGMETAATVPLFNLWSVWWNADRAAAGYSGYWDAPMFYPSEKSFAFSEPMPLSVMAAPIIWITGNRILAYNCLLLFFIWLNAMTAFALLLRLGYGRLPALLGGAMLEMLPLLHSFSGVLQLVPIFGILATILAVHRMGRRPTVSIGLLTGGALAVTYLLCSYYGMFLFILLVFCGGLLLWRQALNPGLYFALISGVLLCGVVCLPVITTQQQAVKIHQRDLPLAYVTQLSAEMESYRVPPYPSCFDGKGSKSAEENLPFKLAPGKIKLGLMLLGMAWGLARPARRGWTLFCTALMVAAFLLSLGPRLQFFEWRPYLFLMDWVPGLAHARNVFRFALFVHIALTLLAVQGVLAAAVLLRRYLPRGRRCWGGGALTLVAIFALIEIWPAAQPLYAVPLIEQNLGWTGYLRTRTAAESIVACLPFAFKPDVAAYQQETQWLYWGTFHKRRMINGYSGIFPQSFPDLKWAMAEFPTRELITRLGDLGVDYCVVRQDTYYGEAARQYVRFDPRFKMVHRDDRARIDIYRLTADKEISAVSNTGMAENLMFQTTSK